MSNTIMEAMALQVPVIARNIEGNRFIIDGKTGFLYDTPSEFEDLATKIIQGNVESNKLRANIVSNAYKFIQNFSSKKEVDCLNLLINTL